MNLMLKKYFTTQYMPIVLIICLLFSPHTTTALNPSAAKYIGLASGLVIGTAIGYALCPKITEKVAVPLKEPLTKTQRVKEFIKTKYPIALGAVMGALVGVTGGTIFIKYFSEYQKQHYITSAQKQLKINQIHQKNLKNMLNLKTYKAIEKELENSASAVKGLNLNSSLIDAKAAMEKTINLYYFMQYLSTNVSFGTVLSYQKLQNGECELCNDKKNNIYTYFCKCSLAENKHFTCQDCLKDWLNRHNTCPYCTEKM